MSSSSNKGKKSHRKDAVRSQRPHFTDKSRASHFHGSADYKQRIKVLSKNNKELTTALQNSRNDLACKEKALDNIKSARVTLIKMHSSMKFFMKDFEQVLCLLNSNDTKYPVSRSLLQPRSEFRKEKNVTPSLMREILVEGTSMIAAKEVESSHNCKNDKSDAVKNHHVSADQATKVSNGTAEESTSKSWPNGIMEKSTKKRKFLSNNSEQDISKKAKSVFDEESTEQSSDQILRNSFKTPSRKRSLQSKKEKINRKESTAAESSEKICAPTSVKSAKRLRKKSQLGSTADKINDEEYEEVESNSENEMKNTVSRDSSRRIGSVDSVSPCETFVPELDTEHIKEKTSCQNSKSLSKISKGKTLSNKREEISCQKEQDAEESQSEELRSASILMKSFRMLRRGSQVESTSNKSKNDKLEIQNPGSVKKKKKHGQIVSGKVVNRNTETLKRETVVSVNDAFQNEILISESKSSLNKLSVKCCDVLIDPSFESDPVVNKFKKNNLKNYKVNKEKIFSIKTDNKDENLDTKDISDSSKQASLFHNELDVIETEKTVYMNRRRGKHKASRVDDSSEEELPLHQLNASNKKVVSSATGELSDMVTEKVDLTVGGQDAKPKEKFNLDKADLSEDRTGKAKATDADSEDNGEYENESECGKESGEKQADKQREKIVSQEEQRAEEVKSTLLSVKSLRMLKKGSQKGSTADESKNELKIESLATVKKKKIHNQIESKNTANSNKNLKKGRSTGKAVSVDNAFQNESVTSESKESFNKVIVKCCDILVDPSFESDPVVRKFKKNKLLNYDSPRDYEGSGKRETFEIHAEIHAEPEIPLKNPDCEDENPDMEDINESSKQVPSTPYESDSVKTKSSSRYYSTSGRGKFRASNVDDSLHDETSLNQPTASGKNDVTFPAGELSDLDFEMSDSTSVGQMNKPAKELNENKTDLNENEVKMESDAVATEDTDADSKDKEKNENDSESCVVKKYKQRSAGNSSKQTLQNKRELDNQEVMSAEESESEDLRSALYSIESIKLPRTGSQAKSNTDESKHDKLKIINPSSVKKIKTCSQIKSTKTANRNTEIISKNEKVVSSYDAFRDETLISESKRSANKLFVKCVNVLIDPSFESVPVISQFKKDNFLNCDSPRDEGEFYEILDDDDEEQEFSDNPDSEDENLGTENIESSKQAPLFHNESDVIETEKTVYMSNRRRGKDKASRVDDSSEDELPLSQLNASNKKVVSSATGELSDMVTEKLDLTVGGQDSKPKEKFSTTYESDSVKTKTVLPRNSRKGTLIPSSVDDELSQGETSLNQLNASEKEDVQSKTSELSDFNSEKFCSTDLSQGDKLKSELKKDEAGEIETNSDDTKASDADSKHEEGNRNESESCMIKENEDKQDSNKVSEIVSKADKAEITDADSKEENERQSESSIVKGNRDEADLNEDKVAETESNTDENKATDASSKDKEENECESKSSMVKENLKEQADEQRSADNHGTDIFHKDD